jgi:hypothetical protein
MPVSQVPRAVACSAATPRWRSRRAAVTCSASAHQEESAAVSLTRRKAAASLAASAVVLNSKTAAAIAADVAAADPYAVPTPQVRLFHVLTAALPSD